jgi:large conductance mechanosensitive channel
MPCELASMIKGFGSFIMRGNVIDLAVAVVIGAAFGGVVSSFVKDLITPLIAALFGKPDFAALTFTINNSKFAVGDFINAVVGFLLVAFAIYFFVISPMNAITTRFKKPATDEVPALRECPECMSDIPAAATRCKFCTATSAPVRN